MTKIDWKRYDKDDPNTYPPESREKYLLTCLDWHEKKPRYKRIFTAYWIDDFLRFGAYEENGSCVLFWAKVEPCTDFWGHLEEVKGEGK